MADGTEHIQPATLRGAAPDQTLILVNGKRRHPSALLNLNGTARGSVSADLNSIPAIAIERVEILRDGAAAQYGSDAIAGVINFITKKANKNGSFHITAGMHNTTLDGVPELLAIQFDENGVPIENGSSRLARINGDDIERTDGEAINLSVNYGLAINDAGYLNISAEYNNENRTNRGGQDDGDTYARLDNGTRDARELTTNRDRFLYGKPTSESFTALINGGYTFTDNSELYLTATVQNRDVTSGAIYREASDEGYGVQSIYADGFTPHINSHINDFSFIVGLAGEVGQWGYDVSTVYGQNKIAYYNSNTANATYLEDTATEFYGGFLRYKQSTTNADFSRTYAVDGLASSLIVAFGAEYRHEQYQMSSGDKEAYTNNLLTDSDGNLTLDEDGNQQYGDALLPVGSHLFAQGSLYFSDDDNLTESRNAVSLYGELDADITDKFNTTLAARFERYSDFGSTTNVKIAARYEFTDDFAVRASFSTGFRAPSLAQQYYNATTTSFIDGVPIDVGTFSSTSVVAQALGGQQLTPEKSTNYSVGLTWDPIVDLFFTFDVYQFDIDERIVLSETLGNNDNERVIVQQVFDQYGIEGVGSARFFLNGVNSATEGADLTANYTITNNKSTLLISSAFNYNRTTVSDVIATAGPASLFDSSTLFSRTSTGRLENSAPRTKSNVSLTWKHKAIEWLVRANYYGEITVTSSSEKNDRVISPEVIMDTELNYHFSESLTASLGINNILDIYPESQVDRKGGADSASQFNFIAPYSSYTPWGFQGRYLYAKMKFDF